MLGDEEESHDGRSIGGDTASAQDKHHNRSGSGKSSVHSGKYPSGYPRSNQGGRFSTSSTPPSGNEGGGAGAGVSPDGNVNNNHYDTEIFKTPLTAYQQQAEKDYFVNSTTRSGSKSRTPSSSEEDKFGEAGELRGPPLQSAVAQAAEQARKAEELRRRGSVDERSMTMGGRGRLFVANPDLDD